MMLANHVEQAVLMELVHEALPAGRVVSGAPTVGTAVLGELGSTSIGVWEISAPSVSTDVEVDEFFVVLQGEATVSFADGSPALELRPGVVGRLAAGTHTTWTVRQTLRKIYFIA
jgi:uncharacterized cupin superfamily protein